MLQKTGQGGSDDGPMVMVKPMVNLYFGKVVGKSIPTQKT